MRGLKSAIQDKIRVQMLFMLSEARNIVLKVEMLMKDRVGSNNIFDRFDIFRRQYNETNILQQTKSGSNLALKYLLTNLARLSISLKLYIGSN
jgi:hypothetical protein